MADNILTQIEVEQIRSVCSLSEMSAINTITQAVELLERVKRGVINDGHMTSKLWTDILYFLDSYHAGEKEAGK